jgi:hypothetical protein
MRASEGTTICKSLRPSVSPAEPWPGMYTYLYTLAEPFQAESYGSMRNSCSDFKLKNAC